MKLSDYIKEVIDNRGKNLPRYYEKEKYPVIDNVMIKNTLYPDLNSATRCIDQEIHDTCLRGFIFKDMPLITLVGNGIGNVTLAPSSEAVIVQNTIGFKVKDTLDQVYLYYYLLSNQQRIRNFNRGSGQPSVKKTDILAMEVEFPKLEHQKKIVSVLKPIDEKIERNNQINRNLSEQAMAIYKEMVLDLSEDEFSEGVISDIADVVMGQSPKGDTYNEDGNGSVFYQGRAEFGERFPTRRLFTTDPKRMAKENSVLMSVRAPVGDINVAYEECCIGRGLCSVSSKDNHQSFVLYTMYNLKDEFDVYNGEGTVFGSINKDSMNGMSVRIPKQEILDRFEELVKPIDLMIRTNYEVNCRLISIRDALLPKLMSGSLDISDLEI